MGTQPPIAIGDAKAGELKELNIILARLAVEYWKLLRSFERAIDVTPHDAKVRLSAQARYAAGRLEELLSDAKMKIVSFDGMTFEVNLPAVAINGEDVSGLHNVIVERTIEPAVIFDMNVILMGKVFLTQSSKGGDQ
jgi:hypothetical protein